MAEELVLYSTFEEIETALSGHDLNTKLMEFVEPLPEVEGEINAIAAGLSVAGRVAFMLGQPGSGKSTFIRSLHWRPSTYIRKIEAVDTSTLNLDELFDCLGPIATEATKHSDAGVTVVVLNYLEDLSGYQPAEVKGFFRRLNGLLRQHPILILWPVTSEDDVREMMSYAEGVSRSLFVRNREILDFKGPEKSTFKDIVQRTVSVLNDGRELTDFALTYDDLTEIDERFSRLSQVSQTMREYIELVKEKWRHNSGYLAAINRSIPKSTEVWFVFAYPQAEDTVAQFVRRSSRVEDNWTTIHDKLYEYIRNSQKRNQWTAKRLQMALFGSIKTRILFLPTNALVSAVAAFADSDRAREVVERTGIPSDWSKRSTALRFLQTTSVYKQLIGEQIHVGKRKGAPAAEALRKATPAYEALCDWVASRGSGSDKHVNAAIARCMAETSSIEAVSDKRHPWIPSIVPDIFVDTPHRQYCLEFHYTKRDEPGVVADYVLNKLNTYMNQIEGLIEA